MISKAMNRVLAKQDPEGNFDSPLGIVDETLFTRGEKIATLNPPPITGNDAFKRLGEYRKTTLAAYKRWSRGTDE